MVFDEGPVETFVGMTALDIFKETIGTISSQTVMIS